MNVLFYMIPKAKVETIKDTFTLRQAVEKMNECGYAAIPIINEKGEYIETINNGDILHHLRENLNLDLYDAEKVSVMSVSIKRKTKAIKVYQTMENLMEVAKTQNFVPVVDDSNHFIGMVTRGAIITYFESRLKEFENKPGN